MTRLRLQILDDKLLEQIIDEGFELLMDPGIRVHNNEALELLAHAGARVNFEHESPGFLNLWREVLWSVSQRSFIYIL
jgi:trimethylamine:corrinoid methyltransferase-like protein